MTWLRSLWLVLRTHDAYEYLVCADCDWKIVWSATDYQACPSCGGEVQVQLPRREALDLLIFDLRTAFLPHRTYDFSRGETTTESWWWRGNIRYEREIENPFKR